MVEAVSRFHHFARITYVKMFFEQDEMER